MPGYQRRHRAHVIVVLLRIVDGVVENDVDRRASLLRAGCVEQITFRSAAPSRGIVERHHGRQQRLDLLHAAGFRRMRT